MFVVIFVITIFLFKIVLIIILWGLWWSLRLNLLGAQFSYIWYNFILKRLIGLFLWIFLFFFKVIIFIRFFNWCFLITLFNLFNFHRGYSFFTIFILVNLAVFIIYFRLPILWVWIVFLVIWLFSFWRLWVRWNGLLLFILGKHLLDR